jgi:hypothetical protein
MEYYSALKKLVRFTEEECRALALNRLFNDFKQEYNTNFREKYSHRFVHAFEYVTKMIKIRDRLDDVKPRSEWAELKSEDDYSDLIYKFLLNLDDFDLLIRRDHKLSSKKYLMPFLEGLVEEGLSDEEAKRVMYEKIAYPKEGKPEEFNKYERKFLRMRDRVKRVIDNSFKFELPHISFKLIPVKMSLEEFVKKHYTDKVRDLYGESKRDEVTKYYLSKYEDYVINLYKSTGEVDFSMVSGTKKAENKLHNTLVLIKNNYEDMSERSKTVNSLRVLFERMKDITRNRRVYKKYTRKFTWKLDFVIDDELMNEKIDYILKNNNINNQEEFMRAFLLKIRSDVRKQVKHKTIKLQDTWKEYLINNQDYNLLFKVRDRSKIRNGLFTLMEGVGVERVITNKLIDKVVNEEYTPDDKFSLQWMHFKLAQEIKKRGLFKIL